MDKEAVRELWETCYGKDRFSGEKREAFTVVEFRSKIADRGLSAVFPKLQENGSTCFFLTERNGITWVLPLNHRVAQYLPHEMYDTSALARFLPMWTLLEPCQGKFEGDRFQVISRGIVW